jgi:hypothetical protein
MEEILMARKNKPKKVEFREPYCMAALLCEKIVQEPDGVPTIVRAIDKITFQVPEALLGVIPGFGWQGSLLLIFKSGTAKVKKTVIVKGINPDGTELMEDISSKITFAGDDGLSGSNVYIQLTLMVRMKGLHWFHVLLDGKRVMRVPFIVEFKDTKSAPLSTSAVIRTKK